MSVSVLPLDTANLGNRSYLAHDGAVAVAVDVPRDVDRMIALAAEQGVRITWVLDTHGHGDWLTGGPALARLVGARYAAPEEVGGPGPRLTVADGTVVHAGAMTLRARHTPGHTLGHMSYELVDGESVFGVFSGGSLLHGAVGRPDLVGPAHTERLAHAQYASVRALVGSLPEKAVVLPMHGFGSFCSATPTSGDSSTIADEREANPALTEAEDVFVAELLAGLDAYPAYYARMAPANASGPGLIDLRPPPVAGAVEIRRRLEAGEWVVDLRSRRAFATGHLPGSWNVEGEGNAVTYLGWLVPADAPVTLLGEDAEQVARVQRELALIRLDRPAAAATGDVATWADGQRLRSYRTGIFAELASSASAGAVVLDVRRNLEWRDGHLAGAVHIPLHELPDRLDEVPDGEVWVHCSSGFRAAIAASLLDRAGRHRVVVVDDDYANAAQAGCAPAR